MGGEKLLARKEAKELRPRCTFLPTGSHETTSTIPHLLIFSIWAACVHKEKINLQVHTKFKQQKYVHVWNKNFLALLFLLFGAFPCRLPLLYDSTHVSFPADIITENIFWGTWDCYSTAQITRKGWEVKSFSIKIILEVERLKGQV